jgi:ribosomal protein L37E
MECPNCKENPFFEDEEQCHACGFVNHNNGEVKA